MPGAILDPAAASRMIRSALEIAAELEHLTGAGVLTDECRNFPGDAELERARPGFRARRRRLHAEVKRLVAQLFDDGVGLLPALELLRQTCADSMRVSGTKSAVRQLVLAEISTAFVAASYDGARRTLQW